jgi:hypothetical protein
MLTLRKIYQILFLPILLSAGFAGTSQGAFAWDVNDVSFLLPLPSDLKSDSILVPGTLGSAGQLLPQRYLEPLPSLVQGADDGPVLESLTVVGIRIDPCFPGVDPSGEPCRSVIRMVWQPLSANGTAMDSAVHSFYLLSSDEFKDLLQKIAALNVSSGFSSHGLPLQVHPLIASQGLSGNYWRSLRAILLAYTGESRLMRVTFMTQESLNQMWDFGGFDIIGGRISRMIIPRVLTRMQSFVNTDATLGDFIGGEKPEAPTDVDTFNRILTGSSVLTASDVAVLRASADSINRIENPKIHSPATIDCVSCHVAQPARIWAETKFSTLGLEQSTFRFQSSLNLQNVTAAQATTHTMRAFGYEGRVPSINQRTINESAAIAESLNSGQANGNSKLTTAVQSGRK